MEETTITAARNHAFPDSAIRADAVRSLQALITQELDGMTTMHEARRISCPHCKSPHRAKRGHDSLGRQRFLCGGCGRSYTAHSGSAFAGAKLSRETWMRFAECHVDTLSLREAAAQCGICLKTAFLMRKRILILLARQASIRGLVAQKGLPRILPIACDCSRDPVRAYTVARRMGFDAPAAEKAIAKCVVIASAATVHQELQWRESSRSHTPERTSPPNDVHAALWAFMKQFHHVKKRNLPGYHAWFEWAVALNMKELARKEARAVLSIVTHREHEPPRATAINLKLTAMRCTSQLLARWRLATP